MDCLNTIKSTNAKVVLADGSSLGAITENLSYKELTGVIGMCLKFVSGYRQAQLSSLGSDTLLHEIKKGEFETLIDGAHECKAISTCKMEHLKNVIMTLKADPQYGSAITKDFMAKVLIMLSSRTAVISRTEDEEAVAHLKNTLDKSNGNPPISAVESMTTMTQ
jgi:hypothetical protein